jgi:hypothetical protein
MRARDLLLVAALGMAATALVVAQNSNPAGAVAIAPIIEAYTGVTASNPAGATVTLAGPMDVSADATNPAGAKLYLGVFDPTHSSSSDATEWNKYH